MNDIYTWLDEIIKNQKGQMDILDSITSPFSAADICDMVREIDEPNN